MLWAMLGERHVTKIAIWTTAVHCAWVVTDSLVAANAKPALIHVAAKRLSLADSSVGIRSAIASGQVKVTALARAAGTFLRRPAERGRELRNLRLLRRELQCIRHSAELRKGTSLHLSH